MQTDKKESTKCSKGSGLINYHVNLNFDMRTSNTSGDSHTILTPTEEVNSVNPIQVPNIPSNREPSVSSEDLSGKSNDNRHLNNHDIRTGYSTSIVSANGKPHGNSHLSDIVDGVQNDRSKGHCSGDETVLQTLKAHGKPHGNRHAAGKQMTVDPTLVPPSSNPDLKRTEDIYDLNDPSKLAELTRTYVPVEHEKYHLVHRYELRAARCTRIGVRPNLPRKHGRMFRNEQNEEEYTKSIVTINKYRRSQSILEFPELDHWPQPTKYLRPMFEADHPVAEDHILFASSYQKYKEDIRLSQVEIEVIHWITTGVIPKLTESERNQLTQDLIVINKVRLQSEHQHDDMPEYSLLDLDKSFEDYFVKKNGSSYPNPN